MIKLSFKALEEEAFLPSIKNETDAGYDIYSIEDIIIQPGKTKTVKTGIALEMSFDFLPFDISERLPYKIHQEQVEFAENFTYYLQEWIKQQFKLMFQIESRSGLASKEGISVIGGIVDQDYQGEISIILVNNNQKSYYIKSGDRIAQGIPKALPRVSKVVWTDDFKNTTDRGIKGLGSSGK